MIVEWFVGAVAVIWNWVVGIIPDLPEPTAVGTASGYISTMGQWVARFGSWVNVTYVGVAIAIVLSALAAAFVIKIARILISFATVGGGSAG